MGSRASVLSPVRRDFPPDGAIRQPHAAPAGRTSPVARLTGGPSAKSRNLYEWTGVSVVPIQLSI
ncbi:hypothetical protein LJK88_11645 [Paenibacillus sp. P26]|nr:hypothetical protein LJK88_11645 [Paenibacillus sp. P26]UUZ89567.1 hypothetical protein LJK87_26035 [Paenibacillus sp. P25]